MKLTDQHLVAEIKEINQLAGQFRKSMGSKKGLHGIPKTFCLGKGHVKFFYDKGKFLRQRFIELQLEAVRRGFKAEAAFSDAWSHLEPYNNDWVPTQQDIVLSEERIRLKLEQKPNFYRYYGKKIKEGTQ